jgi:hypothetical protein
MASHLVEPMILSAQLGIAALPEELMDQVRGDFRLQLNDSAEPACIGGAGSASFASTALAMVATSTLRCVVRINSWHAPGPVPHGAWCC